MIQISREAHEKLLGEAEGARQRRDLGTAERLFLAIIREDARHARALAGLGYVYRDFGRADLAAEGFGRAIEAGHPDVTLFNELGRALLNMGQNARAVEVLRRAVERRPADAETWNDLGIALAAVMEREQAAEAYRRALSLQADYVPAWNNYGGILRSQGRLAEAVEAFERALAINPAFAEIENNRAEALMMMGRQEEAIAAYERVVAARPRVPFIRDGYLYALQLVETPAAKVFEEHRRWDRDFAQPLAAHRQPYANDRTVDRRLRVGYVSADFRTHSVAFFMLPILQNHDAEAVEVFCYADPPSADAMTGRMKACVHHWREIHGYSPLRLADLVREDRIDILVDLHGHTVGSRLLTFAMKPAPVQVTYLGYPATTGLSAMDYRLTDDRADPSEALYGAPVADALHSEKLVRLPETFLCWMPPEQSPGPVAEARGDRRFMFGSFNALPKVSAATIRMWGAILRERPEAGMLIKAVGLGDAGTRRSVLEKFSREGIAADRLTLVDRVPSLASHLAMYQEVDVALDTYPYGGTTTTCEALWMGLPVVTRAGNVHAARVGASLLHSVGLDDLVAADEGAYVATAVGIAGDEVRRQALRQSLRARMLASPLMDGQRFTRQLEKAYRGMWAAWCRGG